MESTVRKRGGRRLHAALSESGGEGRDGTGADVRRKRLVPDRDA